MAKRHPSKKTGANSASTRKGKAGSSGTYQFFDKLLKRLAQPLTQVLLSKLTNQRVLAVKELDREITRLRSSKKHLDYLARVQIGGEETHEILVHLEFQTKNDKAMPLRMLEYGIEIYRKYNQYPFQIIVYMGTTPLRMNKCFTQDLGVTRLEYCTSIIDLTSLDPEEFLSLQDIKTPDVLLLAALSLKNQDPKASHVFQEIMKELAKQDHETRNEYVLFLEVIAQTKHLVSILQEVRTMFDVKLEDIPSIKKIKEEGKKEGKKEGLKEGLKEGAIKTILRQIKKKYQLSKTQENHVKQLLEKQSLKKINTLAELLITPITFDEFLQQIKA